MQITVRLFCIIGCFLLVTSCSRPRGEKATADLVGKWRTEKLDVERLINEMNEKGFGMPAQLRSSVEEKLKQAGSLTGDWEFNADGTAKFGRTGKELTPVTWRLVRSSGDTLIVELNPNTDSRTTWEITFLGKDRVSMRCIDDEGEPSVVCNRVHEF
jgi:hypothetical protein